MAKVVYNPLTGMIGCVLIQAVHGCDSSVSHLFSTEDWELAPTEGQGKMDATKEQWEFIAGITRQERIDRWAAMTGGN